MAEMVDVVGISHYVEDPAAFTEQLPVGTILTLVLEPENYHDPRAIAVYIKDQLIGHITTGDIDVAMECLFDADKVPVLVRYSGIHEEKSLSLSVNQKIKVTPFHDAIQITPFEDKTPLPYAKAPLILNEERQILYWAHQLDIDTEMLIKRLPSDPFAIALAQEIKSLLEQYVPLADFSLSAECFSTITNIHHRLINLMMIPEYKDMYEGHLKEITAKRDNFIHKKGLDKIFQNQLTLLTDRLEQNGFFEDLSAEIFEDMDMPSRDEIGELANGIKEWLKKIPSKAANYRITNPQKFVEILYGDRLNYMDLYMVYAAMIILEYTKEYFSQWVDRGSSAPKELRHRSVIKVIGNIKELIFE